MQPLPTGELREKDCPACNGEDTLEIVPEIQGPYRGTDGMGDVHIEHECSECHARMMLIYVYSGEIAYIKGKEENGQPETG